jgi:hypothetical protein
MKQSRLEAIKLAVGLSDDPKQVLEIAERFANYIEDGVKVVELNVKSEGETPPAPLTRRQRRRAMGQG